jgi:hypothetical protein
MIGMLGRTKELPVGEESVRFRATLLEVLPSCEGFHGLLLMRRTGGSKGAMNVSIWDDRESFAAAQRVVAGRVGTGPPPGGGTSFRMCTLLDRTTGSEEPEKHPGARVWSMPRPPTAPAGSHELPTIDPFAAVPLANLVVRWVFVPVDADEWIEVAVGNAHRDQATEPPPASLHIPGEEVSGMVEQYVVTAHALTD